MEILKNIIDLTTIETDNTIAGKNVYINLLGTSTVKPYKHKLSYIRSTGTQWINTGVNCSATVMTEVMVANYNSETKCIFGAAVDFDTTTQRYQAVVSNPTRFSGRLNNQTTTFDVASVEEWHMIRLNAKSKTMTVDKTTRTINYGGTLTSNPIALFGRYQNDDFSSTLATMDLEYGKLWDDDVIQRDYIPVIDYNNIVCLYDNITKTFFYNQGTGDFIAGEIIG